MGERNIHRDVHHSIDTLTYRCKQTQVAGFTLLSTALSTRSQNRELREVSRDRRRDESVIDLALFARSANGRGVAAPVMLPSDFEDTDGVLQCVGHTLQILAQGRSVFGTGCCLLREGADGHDIAIDVF